MSTAQQLTQVPCIYLLQPTPASVEPRVPMPLDPQGRAAVSRGGAMPGGSVTVTVSCSGTAAAGNMAENLHAVRRNADAVGSLGGVCVVAHALQRDLGRDTHQSTPPVHPK